MRRAFLTAIVLAATILSMSRSVAVAADSPPIVLTVDDRAFRPSEIHIPAGTKVQITIRNSRTTKAEFESLDLRREKVVPAGGEGSIYVGPLSPGEYSFYDDFAPSARGTIIVQ